MQSTGIIYYLLLKWQWGFNMKKAITVLDEMIKDLQATELSEITENNSRYWIVKEQIKLLEIAKIKIQIKELEV